MQYNKRTGREGPRNHQKSTLFQAWIMWNIWRLPHIPKMLFEGSYVCYKTDLAESKLSRVNLYVEVNPHFNHVKKITDAESLVKYQYTSGTDKKLIHYKPQGMLSFKRGDHFDDVLVDDPLRDAKNPLDVSQIIKVTEIFNDQVVSLPKADGSLHVSGTRQDKHDLFWHLQGNDQFKFCSYPAELDPVKQVVLWPELFSWEKLKQIEKQMGRKSYEKEYLCKPTRALESFFIETDLEPVIGDEAPQKGTFQGMRFEYHGAPFDVSRETEHEVVGGLDIGKKRHPSHLVLYEKIPHMMPVRDERGDIVKEADGSEKREESFKLKQILAIWLQGWDYGLQLDLARALIDCLKVDIMLYDNTRGEFEGFQEAGQMPSAMEPFVFGQKSKRSIATGFEKVVREKRIELIRDERQTRQILNCDNNLQSMETADGHGDSFWSNALAVEAASRPTPQMRWI